MQMDCNCLDLRLSLNQRSFNGLQSSSSLPGVLFLYTVAKQHIVTWLMRLRPFVGLGLVFFCSLSPYFLVLVFPMFDCPVKFLPCHHFAYPKMPLFLGSLKCVKCTVKSLLNNCSSWSWSAFIVANLINLEYSFSSSPSMAPQMCVI